MSGELRYASVGARNYYDYPVPTYVRRVWEVQYVRGPAEPSFLIGGAGRGGEYVLERDVAQQGSPARALWVFDPLTAHGWMSEVHSGSEIVVLHLDGVVPTVSDLLASRPWLVLRWREDPFLDRAARWLQDEAADLSLPIGYAHSSGASEELRVAAIQQLIAAMVAYGCGDARSAGRPASGGLAGGGVRGASAGGNRAGGPAARRHGSRAYRLERAEAWFEAHMHDGAGVAETAHAVGTSIRHLTRLSQESQGESFGRVLHRRRMARASWMLRSGTQPVFEVAAACGYRNQSAFARAVHRYHGRPPLDIREEVELHRRTSRYSD